IIMFPFTPSISKVNDEEVKSEKSEFILDIKNITAATASINISGISNQISQYTTTLSSKKISDQ
ncbi:16424_t:CDS:1, partial [Racocetra fulgida]